MPALPTVEFLQVAAAVSGVSASEQVAYLTGLAAPTTISNLDGSGLRIQWDVTRSRSSKTDSGECTIYNLSPALRAQLFATWRVYNATPTGFRVGVHAGWGGIVNLIMVGDCWEMIPERREGQDILTTFKFGEGQRAITQSTATAPKTYAYTAGNAQVLWLTIQAMFGEAGLRVDQTMLPLFSQAVTATPLAATGKWVLAGDLIANLTDVLDTFGLEWKVYNGQVIFMSRGMTAAAQGSEAFLFNASTGLLSWHATDDDGIEVEALTQASLRVGHQFIVQDSFGVPVGSPGFRVEAVRFTGDTDGDSKMLITGRKSVAI